jgi:hypothetical protein
METVRERVLEALRLATHPLDDGQLSGRPRIHPRQTVNQAARKLEREGLIPPGEWSGRETCERPGGRCGRVNTRGR